MCGIFGLVSTNKNNKDYDLQYMLQVLHHRGPDERNLYSFDNCILGHTRLSIIDPISGKQPMTDAGRNIGLTFNGEIYGYKAIKSKMSYNFNTESDTELLLVLYKKFGLKMVKKLPGMFSFGLWDEKKQFLFCEVCHYQSFS